MTIIERIKRRADDLKLLELIDKKRGDRYAEGYRQGYSDAVADVAAIMLEPDKPERGSSSGHRAS